MTMREPEAIAHGFALDQAPPARRHPQYPLQGKPLDLASIGMQRKWLQTYGGLVRGRPGFEFDVDAEQLAPEYTDQDLAAIDKGSAFTMRYLLGPLTDIAHPHYPLRPAGGALHRPPRLLGVTRTHRPLVRHAESTSKETDLVRGCRAHD